MTGSPPSRPAASCATRSGDLSADQRRALELRVLDDLRFAEIAEQMSTTEPTARMRVMRALRAMRAGIGGGEVTP